MNSQNDKQMDYELRHLAPLDITTELSHEKRVPFWSVNPNVLFQHEYML